MERKTNWKEIEKRENGYKLYFRFVTHEGKLVKVFKCFKGEPDNNNEGGYFKREGAIYYL